MQQAHFLFRNSTIEAFELKCYYDLCPKHALNNFIFIKQNQIVDHSSDCDCKHGTATYYGFEINLVY